MVVALGCTLRWLKLTMHPNARLLSTWTLGWTFWNTMLLYRDRDRHFIQLGYRGKRTLCIVLLGYGFVSTPNSAK